MRSPKFIGVYAPVKEQRNNTRARLYFAWNLDRDRYAVQQLDGAYMAKGAPRLVDAREFATSWRPQPKILAVPLSTPDFRPLLTAPPPRAAELTDATLDALNKARQARQVEQDLRDGFNKAFRALNRPRDRRGALAALATLADAKKGVVPVHKHMFRDFGVALRKKSLNDLALLHARRVVELAPEDDHAHFNMARICDALGMRAEALAHLEKAVSIDSGEEVYHKMLAWIRARK